MKKPIRRDPQNPKIVIETIHEITLGRDDSHDVKFSDFPKDILPTDTIDIVRLEGYEDHGDWNYGETRLIVERNRNETKEEEEERLKKDREFTGNLKNRRRITYLNFRKEFKDEDLPDLDCPRKYSLGCNYGKCDCKLKITN